jgi:hypothetical protein
VNLYAADGTRVISMTPKEAWDLARHISDAANSAYCGISQMSDEDQNHAREILAQQSRASIQSGE